MRNDGDDDEQPSGEHLVVPFTFAVSSLSKLKIWLFLYFFFGTEGQPNKGTQKGCYYHHNLILTSSSRFSGAYGG